MMFHWSDTSDDGTCFNFEFTHFDGKNFGNLDAGLNRAFAKGCDSKLIFAGLRLDSSYLRVTLFSRLCL